MCQSSSLLVLCFLSNSGHFRPQILIKDAKLSHLFHKVSWLCYKCSCSVVSRSCSVICSLFCLYHAIVYVVVPSSCLWCVEHNERVVKNVISKFLESRCLVHMYTSYSNMSLQIGHQLQQIGEFVTAVTPVLLVCEFVSYTSYTSS